MKSTQWVQHISGQGEKWRVDSEWMADKGAFWLVNVGMGQAASLPKSEYVLCVPPERWIDITSELSVDRDHRQLSLNAMMVAQTSNGYRMIKIDLDQPHHKKYAWIIERKVPHG